MLGEEDWRFLTAFHRLNVLTVDSSFLGKNALKNILEALPDSVSQLTINKCNGLDAGTWGATGSAVPLKRLESAGKWTELTLNDFGFELNNRIAEFLLNEIKNRSRNKLILLSLENNSLERIPVQLNFFNNLKVLMLSGNYFKSISSDALSFPSLVTPLVQLILRRCRIEVIRPGAFYEGNTNKKN